MFSAKILVALSGLTLAQALVALTNSDFSGITVGVPFNVTWAGETGLVTLKLKNGPADNQLLVDTLAQGLAANYYVWTPAEDLPEGTYNLEIDDSNGDVNYSPQFEIVGGVELPITSVPYPAPTVTSSSTASSTASSTTTVVVPTYSSSVPSITIGSLSPPLTTAPLSTGPSSYGNITTTSSGLYSNSSLTSVSFVAPSTTVSKSATPPPAASTVVTAGAIRQAVEPLAAMLLGVAGIAFLF